MLNALLEVSLVERHDSHEWKTLEYLCSPLVADWLREKEGLAEPELALLKTAAEYQRWLFDQERQTLNQAMAVHQALQRAQEQEAADRFALDYIVGPLNRAGFFRTLLTEWLPSICGSGDTQIRADALNQRGKQHHHLGEYERALEYLEQSLAIRQAIGDKAGEGATLNNISAIYHANGEYERALEYLEQSLAIQQAIGDKAGEGATLNNISQIFKARGEYERALEYLEQSLAIRQAIGDVAGLCYTLFNIGHIHWQNKNQQQALAAWLSVYQLAKKLNLAEVLRALENLAGQLGLEGGLEGWERLLQQMKPEAPGGAS